MSQAGSISSSGGGGGISSVSAGLGIQVNTISGNATVKNTGLIIYKSSLINFKNSGATLIFTSTPTQNFFIISYTCYTTVSTSANFDNVYNLGWTPASQYDDYTQQVFGNGVPVGSFNVNQAPQPALIVPTNTGFYIDVVTPDSGTSLQGYVILSGFYF